MNYLQRLFYSHPESVGEGYWQHMASALSFALNMAVGCVVCLVHAILPFAFTKTGSTLITRMHERMVISRAG
jgi:hypothetical protein